MDLPEAAKILTTLAGNKSRRGLTYQAKACQLGAEALKEIIELREDPAGYFKDHLLPSENQTPERERR